MRNWELQVSLLYVILKSKGLFSLRSEKPGKSPRSVSFLDSVGTWRVVGLELLKSSNEKGERQGAQPIDYSWPP